MDLTLTFLACVCIMTSYSGCTHPRANEPPLNSMAEAYRQKAIKYFLEHRDDEGWDALRQAILLNPEHPWAYGDALMFSSDGKRNDFALGIFQDALQAKQDSAMAFYAMGVTDRRMSRWGDAIGAYKELVRITPYDGNAHYELGALYLTVGNKEDALNQYEALRELKAWSWPFSTERWLYDTRARQLRHCIDTGEVVLSRVGGCTADFGE